MRGLTTGGAIRKETSRFNRQDITKIKRETSKHEQKDKQQVGNTKTEQ